MWQEFKPTIFFLIRFFVIYFGFSALYGYFIRHYDMAEPPATDPITRLVTYNCANTFGWLGYEPAVVRNDHLNAEVMPEQTYDSLWLDDNYAVSIEEGCNGINIMIVFMAFVVAIGGRLPNMLLFIPAGLIFIHLANILRLLLLSLLNVEWGGRAFHFFHKYGFTAVLYLAILILWYLWVSRYSGKNISLKSKG